ncbi:MAG TPA: radical SAM family heme chaperone HemW [Candidatus Methylomirabilis sp.]|jgi:oxygen-independent coproporphyrinogen-3 oxidase
MRPFGLYLHIPFCVARCGYCDFNTYLHDPALARTYVDALCAEIAAWARRPEVRGRPAATVFFGGGTPSLLAPGEVARILAAVRAAFPPAPGAEVTLEANPGTVDHAGLAGLRAAGVNRLSLGVQAFQDRLLRVAGRDHTAEDARRAVAEARAAGFANLSLDLIFALPGQTLDDWEATLAEAAALAPEHLSAYGLTYEEGTPFHRDRRAGRLTPVDEATEAAMFDLAVAHLAAAGYEQYEISNFARPGFRSAHNQTYWRCGDYLGLGAGAHSCLEGRRTFNRRLPQDYIAAVRREGTAQAGGEHLTPRQQLGEAMVLGLRLREGVDLEALAARFAPWGLAPDAATLERLDGAGLVERDGSRLRLTDRGIRLANEVFVALV